MKSERGVTLTALVTYMTVFVIIIGVITTISSHLYKNIIKIKDMPEYIPEFNKFSMFFVADVKKNNKITSISSSNIEFGDGTKYSYRDESIYRNDKKIAKYVKSFSFKGSDDTVNNFTKKIVNVTAEFGKNNKTITRNIDFVLKYW